MKLNRALVAGAALLAAVSLTACGPDAGTDATGTAASSAASPTPAPLDELEAAMKTLNTTSETFTVSSDGKQLVSGTFDLENKALNVVAKIDTDGVSVTFEELVVDSEVFVKLDFGTKLNKQLKIDPKKYQKVDLAKITDKSSLTIDPADPDPLGLTSLLDSLSNVKTDGAGSFSGLIDLTKAGSDSLLALGHDASGDGDNVSAVPFTATVNAAGQLTSFKTDGTGIDDAVTQDIEFADFGQATVTKPTTFVNASSAIYQILNSEG